MTIDANIFKKLTMRQRPEPEEFEAAIKTMLSEDRDDVQIGALLLGLEMIGLTSQEVRIGTKVMRENMTPVHIDADVIDIVGTGGTGLHTLSISTASAIVCAGAGAKVAKHGNRAASSLAGTADVLSELGVNLGMSPELAAKCVMEAGIGFLFAPNHHPAMRYVGPARKSLGVRTLFNILGPLSNPAGAKRMLLGVCEDHWRLPMAEALRDLGATHAWVVYGGDGLDEVTTTTVTHVAEVKDGKVTEFVIHPLEYGIAKSDMAHLKGGTPVQNASSLRRLLDGETGPYRDIVQLNSGIALHIAGLAETVEDGMKLSATSIESGDAKAALESLVEVSNDG